MGDMESPQHGIPLLLNSLCLQENVSSGQTTKFIILCLNISFFQYLASVSSRINKMFASYIGDCVGVTASEMSARRETAV